MVFYIRLFHFEEMCRGKRNEDGCPIRHKKFTIHDYQIPCHYHIANFKMSIKLVNNISMKLNKNRRHLRLMRYRKSPQKISEVIKKKHIILMTS